MTTKPRVARLRPVFSLCAAYLTALATATALVPAPAPAQEVPPGEEGIFLTVPNPITEIHIHHLGGAMGRVPGDATAFGARDHEFILNVVARSARHPRDCWWYGLLMAAARPSRGSMPTDL